jgi:hypothetical protein
VFEYLLGCPEIAHDVELRQVLWKNKRGGFEAALEEVQRNFYHERNNASKERLDRLQGAVSAMFRMMNGAFDKIVDFEPARPPCVGTRLLDLLTRFDAIFTLNQDLLLERHYQPKVMQNPSHCRWSGAVFPGVRVKATTQNLLERRWEPVEKPELGMQTQPIFKLHGSSQWLDSNGGELLIMGGNKPGAIQAHSILSWYQEVFSEYLRSRDARLMVIGYSFGDRHINSMLESAAECGLRIFVVDPLGSDLLRPRNPPPGSLGEPPMPTEREAMLIGSSRRSLTETFGRIDVEHAKIMWFFDVCCGPRLSPQSRPPPRPRGTARRRAAFAAGEGRR